jgi:hypothetical protein
MITPVEEDADIEEAYQRLHYRLQRMANCSPADKSPLHCYGQLIDRRFLGNACFEALLLIDRMRALSYPTWREDTKKAAQKSYRLYKVLTEIQLMAERELTADAEVHSPDTSLKG